MSAADHNDLAELECVQNAALLIGTVALLVDPLAEGVRLLRRPHLLVRVDLKLFLRGPEIVVHPDHAVLSGQRVDALTLLVSGHHDVVIRALSGRGYL